MAAQPRRKRGAERDPVAERLWVEQLALLFETNNKNFPRTAGRILGLMLIADEAVMTQAELAERLDVSQASVSPALRYLIEVGYLERTRTPGVRAEQYRLRDQSWSSVIEAAVLSAEMLIRHLDNGLALPGPDLSAGRVQLAKLADFYRGFLEIMREAQARL
jgi:hypothetical protein